MFKTILVISLVLHFNSGENLDFPGNVIGPFDTIEECRDEYVRIKALADKDAADPENELQGIDVLWECRTVPVQDIEPPVEEPKEYRF